MTAFTEWGELTHVVLGRALSHAWPENDKFFNETIKASTWTKTKWNPKLPNWLLNEAEEDLYRLHEIFDAENIRVSRTTCDCYNARDVLFHFDKTYVCPTPFTYRRNEPSKFKPWLKDYTVIPIKDNCLFDAANLLKFGDKIVYQVSMTGQKAGAKLLQDTLDVEVVTWENVYAFAHIDSTCLPLNNNTLLLNGDRVKSDNLPTFLKSFRKIWVRDIIPQEFFNFPYSSKWIGMNVLSINPETVLVDSFQTFLIEQLREEGFRVITSPMRHSRTLGGGMHCVTLDLERK